MSTYTQGCSQVGGFSYAKNFTLYVVLNEKEVNSSSNTSKVDYNVYCQSSGSGSIRANHQLYFSINGSTVRNENVYVNASSPNAYIQIASGTITVSHNNDGSKSIGFDASIKATGGYGVSASCSGTFWLTTIGRYIDSYNFSLSSSSMTSIKVNWSCNPSCSSVQYSINNGGWINVSGSGTSGSFNINGLNPNTSYSIKLSFRRADSGLWRETSSSSTTTKDISRISTINNFEHGNSFNVNVSNPSNQTMTLVLKSGNTQILSRSIKAGNNTITMSDGELDTLYKRYGNSNSLTLTATITGGGYSNSKNCTVTLKGNQKTIRININNSWKRGKTYVKMNNSWKKAVVWIKVNNSWKRTI